MSETPELKLAPETYYKAEARPVGELKKYWRDFASKEVDMQKWLDLRDKCRKDLFFLGKKILRKDLAACHWIPCTRVFVQKQFDGVYHLGYTIGEVHAAIDRQTRGGKAPCATAKDCLWLDPRGGFKSTLDGIDCVQWMLNCPDIRILILTGEYKLALAFLSEIKGYFHLPDKGDKQLLHKLFPEYILHGKDGKSDAPLECPARIHNQKEPSLWVNAIVANLSGWHCDIRKMDDVVTDENSNSVDARGKDGKLKQKIDGTDNLVDEWGFTDIIGTRYYTDDYYGERLKVAGPEAPLRYLIRPVWKAKPGFENVPLMELKKDMVDLLFPEKLTYETQRRKLVKNERMFRCQQLNEPAGESDAITFSEDVLKAHLVSKAPETGEIFITWDWSFSRNSYADYSAGVVARVVQKPDEPPVLYILEIIFGRWKPSELSFHIVQLNKKWNPKQTMIEKSNGAELLQMEIARQAQRYQVALNILWKQVSVAPDAKRNNIKGVETLLNNDQLYFLGGQWIDETFEQLIKYTGERKNKGRKDDIPDAIGFMAFFLPSTTNNAELQEMKRQREAMIDSQAQYDRIFNGPAAPPRMAPPPISIKQKLFGALAR